MNNQSQLKEGLIFVSMYWKRDYYSFQYNNKGNKTLTVLLLLLETTTTQLIVDSSFSC